VPAEMLTKNGWAESPPLPPSSASEDEVRKWARQHVERVHRLKLHVAACVLGMVVLTPVWLLVEWQDNGSFKHWSNNGHPGDWEPWILYVALIWGLVVAIKALQAYFDQPTTEAEVDREVRRLRSRG
jgi:2TM domain